MHYMVALLILSGALTLGAFFIVTIKRETQKSEHLSLVILCTCLYIAGSVFEATSNSHFSAYRAIVIEYFGLTFIAPHAFLTFIDFYDIELSNRRRWSLFILPLICSVLVGAGNPYNLFYAETGFALYPLPHLMIEPAPLYILSVSYALALLLLTQAIIIRHMRKRRGRAHRRELLLLIAIGLPILSNLLYLFDLTPNGIDVTPVVLAVTSALVVYTVQRLNLLQLLPLAKSAIVEKMTDAFIIVDNRGRFLEANRAAKELFPSLEVIDAGEVFNELEGFCEGCFVPGGPDQEYPPVRAANGRYYHVSQTGIEQSGKTLCTCIMLYDITETHMLIHALDRKASHDALTQVYNRGAFFQMAGLKFTAIAQQDGQAAMLMFDLDHFKKVNDTYGHRCGDAVLKEMTQRLSKRIRDTDVFGRYGGEEFCAFLTYISADNAVALADGLRRCIEAEPFICEGRSITVTMSVGVAAYDKTIHDTPGDMIGSADEALYAAKENGRNRVMLFDKRLTPKKGG